MLKRLRLASEESLARRHFVKMLRVCKHRKIGSAEVEDLTDVRSGPLQLFCRENHQLGGHIKSESLDRVADLAHSTQIQGDELGGGNAHVQVAHRLHHTGAVRQPGFVVALRQRFQLCDLFGDGPGATQHDFTLGRRRGALSSWQVGCRLQ